MPIYFPEDILQSVFGVFSSISQSLPILTALSVPRAILCLALLGSIPTLAAHCFSGINISYPLSLFIFAFRLETGFKGEPVGTFLFVFLTYFFIAFVNLAVDEV